MMGWIVAALALLAAMGVLLWRRRYERCLMARLDAMLSAAIDGDFSESNFDETQCSALESRLAQYLQAGSDGARRLAEQRDQLAGLVSDVSHQTKTPLANIRLYAQLLAEQSLSPQAQECADAIASQSEKLDSLITALVKSSRLETGIIALHPQVTELAPLVRSAISQYTAKAADQGIVLTSGNCSGWAVCDAKWTEEALCNLLDNAVKYTPAGGQVHVDVMNYELFAAIRVRDDGPGIPETEQAKIFARFYRSANAYTAPGVGIGLYLARQIVSGQGGYIKLTSAPGQGSTFALCLPQVAVSERRKDS